MGISGLLPLLKSIHRQRHLREYAGQTLGVDAYGWLHKGTIPCAIELALGKPTTKYVDYVLHRVKMLQFFGVTPFLVFDGDYLPSKASTEAERERRRAASKATGLELLARRKTTDAHREFQKAVDVTPEMARAVIDGCQKLGVRCIVAPYEADAQLYYLEKIGEIGGVISEDSDLLVFGVKRLITKLDQFGDCVEVSRDRFSTCKEVSLAGWSDREFRMMCILSGCDYLDNVAGVGLKKAHGLVKRHKDINKIVRAMQFDAKKSVPADYQKLFIRAEITFLHQRVFCPKENKLVHCNDPNEPLEDEHLIYIGPDLDEDVARGVAYGRLDPMTKAPLKSPHTSINVSTAKSWTPRKPASPKKNKSISSFFKPKSEVKPVMKSPITATRTPLQSRDPNLHALRQIRSAPPLKMSTPTRKRPMSTWSTSNKKPRLVDHDDDPAIGEQSEFFRRKPRKSLGMPPKKPMFTALIKKENTTSANTVVPGTPQKKEKQRAMDFLTPSPVLKLDPSSVDPPVPVQAPNSSTPTSTKTPEARVAHGWKDRFGFPDRTEKRSTNLSAIIERQRKASASRASSSIGGAGTTPCLKASPQQIHSTASKKSSGVTIDARDNSQEEWPEFVGVGKFSQGSGHSSESSQETPSAKGLFGRFAFGVER